TLSSVKLGVTQTSPTVIYASILDGESRHSGVGGIYGSVDAGVHWATASAASDMCNPAPPAMGQCWYDHWIQPDPYNPFVVYFGSVDLYKSTDAGTTWLKLTQNYNTSNIKVPVHPDQHAIAIVPTSTSTIYFGNDGGVYRTTDGGVTFQNLNA